MLPFSHQDFLGVFADYNAAIWPAQIAAYGAGLAAAALIPLRKRWAGRAVLLLLAAMWLWTGAVYHWRFFAPVNAAAYGFGALFVAQGLLLAHAGARGAVRVAVAPPKGRAAAGWGLIVYALAAYPLIGLVAGQRYPELPTFGVTPCPVTLFTFGVLLLAQPRAPARLFVIPFLWSLIGGSAAFLLGVPQDWALLFSGALAAAALYRSGAKGR